MKKFIFFKTVLYRSLFEKDYDCVVPNSTLLEFIINDYKDDVNYIYTKEYIEDRDLHDRVAKSVFKIISKYNLPRHIEQEVILPERFQTIVNEFFSEYGGGINKKFEQLKRDGQIEYLPYYSVSDTATNNIFMLGKTYVVVSTPNTVDGLLSFAHEIGHAYAYSMIEDKDASYDVCLSYYEFYSSFIQRMMTQYLMDKKIFPKDVVKSNMKFFKELELYALDVAGLKNLSSKEIINSKKFVSIIGLFGKYLSLIKEYDYGEDREGTLERIDDYLSSQGMVSKKESLDILGIDYEELISGNKLQKVLKKNNM